MIKYCIKCGTKLIEDNNFCSNCGFKIKENNIEAKEQKSRVVAGLLAIFFGFLGVHNFYLGYTRKGVAMLLITLLSFFLLSGITSTWGLIEGIMILTKTINVDGNGEELID